MAIKSNYNKVPAVHVDGTVTCGWDAIVEYISKQITGEKSVVAVECYVGVNHNEIKGALSRLTNGLFVETSTLFKSESEVAEMTNGFMTADTLFGFMTNLKMEDYFDQSKLCAAQTSVKNSASLTIIYGHGASLVAPDADITIYADMARWEIQQRFRKHTVVALGIDNSHETISAQYKRGFFNDWKVCDGLKRTLYAKVDYWLDTNVADQPKMIDRKTFLDGMQAGVNAPLRVVPFFDPAPWGGQWMKEVCDLDRHVKNFGWCFDCVPEENSLMLEVKGVNFEMPAVNLVYTKSRELLGEAVEARFGKNFPIRFDFLDTMGGGNLSVQVHPTTEFAHNNFGLQYTQDESYYLIEAEDDATVYLGLKNNTDPQQLIDALRAAHSDNTEFDVDRYINKLPAKKHDHYLIPAGTIHCSGSNAMVLEISSTPNLFTFKLWDWQRLGLDGKPRPINVDRGAEVIDFSRDADYVQTYLANVTEEIGSGDGWCEQKTGLHRNEFIETRRHWFTKKVLHKTSGSVNVLNLVEGDEVIVESPQGCFEPFVVHYAETFIVPESVQEYTIRPYGQAEGCKCATIKAYVRV